MAHKVSSFRCAQGELRKALGDDTIVINSFKDIDAVLSDYGVTPVTSFRAVELALDKIESNKPVEKPADPEPQPTLTDGE